MQTHAISKVYSAEKSSVNILLAVPVVFTAFSAGTFFPFFALGVGATLGMTRIFLSPVPHEFFFMRRRLRVRIFDNDWFINYHDGFSLCVGIINLHNNYTRKVQVKKSAQRYWEIQSLVLQRKSYLGRFGRGFLDLGWFKCYFSTSSVPGTPHMFDNWGKNKRSYKYRKCRL